jgi:hypothetical protein
VIRNPASRNIAVAGSWPTSMRALEYLIAFLAVVSAIGIGIAR